MLFVLGAGSYSPPQQLTDIFLKELGLDVAADLVVRDRRSTLNLDTLKTKKNTDLKEAMASALESCTDMGERAARIAIERAGITVEEIGLVIGDCSTPIEVTPAEAQRVGGRLGLKVPTYDIYTASGVCPAHLAVLSTWKKERLPKYALCVSTNAPTQRVNYQKNDTLSASFGDGATACVVSAEDHRGLQMLSNHFNVDAKGTPNHELDTLGYLTSRSASSDVIRAQATDIFKRLAASPGIADNQSRVKIFWSTRSASIAKEVSETFGFKENQLINDFSVHGDMLGSSSLHALAEQWQTLCPGDRVAVIVADGGLQSGCATFQVRQEG